LCVIRVLHNDDARAVKIFLDDDDDDDDDINRKNSTYYNKFILHKSRRRRRRSVDRPAARCLTSTARIITLNNNITI